MGSVPNILRPFTFILFLEFCREGPAASCYRAPQHPATGPKISAGYKVYHECVSTVFFKVFYHVTDCVHFSDFFFWYFVNIEFLFYFRDKIYDIQ